MAAGDSLKTDFGREEDKEGGLHRSQIAAENEAHHPIYKNAVS